jgi:alkylhydroperoxidase family enzyme
MEARMKSPAVVIPDAMTAIRSLNEALSAWRDTPYFSAAERAALALAEAVTRLSDRTDPVPDGIWDEAARHYDERQLAALVLWIATVNVFNRVNVATRQVPGVWAHRGAD